MIRFFKIQFRVSIASNLPKGCPASSAAKPLPAASIVAFSASSLV